MDSLYSYAITGITSTFPNKAINPSELSTEIIAAGLTNLDYINTDSNMDLCNIYFTSDLTGAGAPGAGGTGTLQQLILNNVIAAHQGTFPIQLIPQVTNPTDVLAGQILIESDTTGAGLTNSLVTISSDGSINIPIGQSITINNIPLMLVVSSPTNGNILITNASGQAIDSGKDFNDSGTTSSDIWSASQVNTAISTALTSLSGWMKYVGTIAGGTATYPAASAGNVWILSSGGTLGGGATVYQAGDMLICNTTNSGGTQTQVGSDFDIVQVNVNGVVSTTDTSSTANNIVIEAGTNGNVYKQSLVSISSTGSINIPLGQTYNINGTPLSKSDVGLSNVTNNKQVIALSSCVAGNVVIWSGTAGNIVADSGIAISSIATNFGTGWQFVTNSSELSTTSTSTYTTHASFTTGMLPSGIYRIEFYCESREGVANKNNDIQLMVDGVAVASSGPYFASNNSDAILPLCGFAVKSLTNAAHTIALQFRVGAANSGGTAYVRNSYIAIQRVS